MTPLEYYDSKGKLVLILLGGLLLAGCGAWMLIANPAPSGSLTRLITMNGALTQFWGALGLIFFGVCSVRLVQMILDKSPRIVLSDQGVLDRTMCKDVILWSDIEKAHVGQTANQKYICLFLKDPSKYKLTGLMALGASANRSMVGTSFTMNMAGLKVPPEDICKEICARIRS